MSITILCVGAGMLFQGQLFREISILFYQVSREKCYSQLPTNDSLLSIIQTKASNQNNNNIKSVNINCVTKYEGQTHFLLKKRTKLNKIR